MKKFITTFLMMAIFAIALPLATNAQTSRRYRTRSYDRPNVYERHRNVFNVGIGTAAGALLGGLIGGKKGALIGAAAGAGGGALYTYKINPKDKRRYYRRY